ncbi:MAG: hypothetical protein MZV63_27545 [Marinilabiliales bacterium]|nr:hypothetical protein [Marinilabiliales bacterium]
MKPFRKIAAELFGFDRRERRGTLPAVSDAHRTCCWSRFTASGPGSGALTISELLAAAPG